MAGIPATNATLYWKIRFKVGDPVAYIEFVRENGESDSVFILRDIEMDRARKKARADRVACPADFAPAEGLSGDRETATAQAAAECLRQAGVTRVVGDRTLPFIFADMIQKAGMKVDCDLDYGVLERRAKDQEEIEHMREAQATTEEIMRIACECVANATAGDDGNLYHEDEVLTADSLRSIIDSWLMGKGYSSPGDIVACGQEGSDCHNSGQGPLKTGQPIIIDIFPCNTATGYNGDCTRSMVHGEIPDEIQRMFDAVKEAKAAGIAAIRPGVTGEDVHKAVIQVMEKHGYPMGIPKEDSPADFCSMSHGTGHGVGLDVHEPPLLDLRGPELIVGDILTVEPGLYSLSLGGVRLEDMVVVTPDGCENFNKLPETLSW